MLRYVSIQNFHSYRTSEKSAVLVIFAETMNNETICFYDFELDVWKSKKKIDKKEFQVRCEKVHWSKEVEIGQCDQECNLSVSKTCQSQFDSFCPTMRICSHWKFQYGIMCKIDLVWLSLTIPKLSLWISQLSPQDSWGILNNFWTIRKIYKEMR